MNDDELAAIPYLPFDQGQRLPPPPWKPTDPALIAWEQGHGHDVRTKCYPEYGCLALDNEIERLENEVRRLAADVAVKDAALRRVEALPAKWLTERLAYPLDDSRASIAFFAVKLCEEELKAALGGVGDHTTTDDEEGL